MKPIILILALFLLNALAAQQHQTLLGRSPLNGAFGAPIYEYTIQDGIQGGIGGGGGLVFRHFFLGAYGVGAISGLTELLEGQTDRLDLAHGGLWLGITPASYNLIHPYISVRGGWGVLDIDLNGDQNFQDLDQVFVVTPEAGLELNLTRWFRVAGTVGYRHIRGVNEAAPAGITDNLEGLIGGITLRFGWFGQRGQRWDSRSSQWRWND